MGGRIELKWMEKRQGFASRCVKLDDKDCKVGKEGELGSPPPRMRGKLSAIFDSPLVFFGVRASFPPSGVPAGAPTSASKKHSRYDCACVTYRYAIVSLTVNDSFTTCPLRPRSL